jgi:DNA-binding GntR family transcriptional regulator
MILCMSERRDYLAELDPNDSRPDSQQIAHQLRSAIQTRALAPGAQLPSQPELATHYGVARETVKNALRLLTAEGLIVSRQGQGTFVKVQRHLRRLSDERYKRGEGVKPPFMTEAEAAGVESHVTYDTAQVRASEEIAERLRIKPGSPVSRTHYQFFADGEPVQVSTQWEPLALTGGTAIEVPEDGPLGKEGVIVRYDSIGIHVTHVHEIVNSRMPTPEEARQLDIPPGTPVFAITRTHWADKIPVETANITAPADRCSIEHTHTLPPT